MCDLPIYICGNGEWIQFIKGYYIHKSNCWISACYRECNVRQHVGTPNRIQLAPFSISCCCAWSTVWSQYPYYLKAALDLQDPSMADQHQQDSPVSPSWDWAILGRGRRFLPYQDILRRYIMACFWQPDECLMPPNQTDLPQKTEGNSRKIQ